MRERTVRPISIGFIKRQNQVLVTEAYDEVKHLQFYRPAGGGIEMGETSQEALIREYQEEFGIKVTIVKFLGVLENIFTYLGKLGHEIVFVYEIRMEDESLYHQENFAGRDDEGHIINMKWKDLEDFETRKSILYPDRLMSLIKIELETSSCKL